jgi:hypothetical protein
MTPYEKLKSIIQAANPEIMELKFGCEFEFPNSGNKMERWIVTSSYGSVDMLDNHQSISIYARRIDDVHSDIFSWDSPEDFEETGQTFYDFAKILGRPIRLADILLAIDKRYDGNHFATAASNGWLHFEGIRGFWNLKDDNLDHQSEETKQFLIELLTSH